MQCCDFPAQYIPAPFSATAETLPSLFDELGTPPLSCVADGCYSAALVNLIGLQYVSDGFTAQLVFNAAESRSLIYLASAGYDGYRTSAYTMSAVPVPAAIWLFLSALIAVPGMLRRA